MGKALEGAHYCLTHQGNHSHYSKENCVVCKLVAERDEYIRQNTRLRSDLSTLELQYSIASLRVVDEKGKRIKAEARVADCVAVAAEAQGILHATLYDQENAPSFSGSTVDYASIEKAVTLLNDISKEPALPVFDADNPRFRQVFDEEVHAHNLPSTRKGDGYRSPITQWCFELAYSVVNRLRLYEK